MRLTTLPTKIGLTLLAAYWIAMVSLFVYARSSGDLKPGASVGTGVRLPTSPLTGMHRHSTAQVNLV